jgi:hypothetical protein
MQKEKEASELIRNIPYGLHVSFHVCFEDDSKTTDISLPVFAAIRGPKEMVSLAMNHILPLYPFGCEGIEKLAIAQEYKLQLLSPTVPRLLYTTSSIRFIRDYVFSSENSDLVKKVFAITIDVFKEQLLPYVPVRPLCGIIIDYSMSMSDILVDVCSDPRISKKKYNSDFSVFISHLIGPAGPFLRLLRESKEQKLKETLEQLKGSIKELVKDTEKNKEALIEAYQKYRCLIVESYPISTNAEAYNECTKFLKANKVNEDLRFSGYFDQVLASVVIPERPIVPHFKKDVEDLRKQSS